MTNAFDRWDIEFNYDMKIIGIFRSLFVPILWWWNCGFCVLCFVCRTDFVNTERWKCSQCIIFLLLLLLLLILYISVWHYKELKVRALYLQFNADGMMHGACGWRNIREFRIWFGFNWCFRFAFSRTLFPSSFSSCFRFMFYFISLRFVPFEVVKRFVGKSFKLNMFRSWMLQFFFVIHFFVIQFHNKIVCVLVETLRLNFDIEFNWQHNKFLSVWYCCWDHDSIG